MPLTKNPQAHWAVLSISLCAIITLIALDVAGVQLGHDSLSYLRQLADMALGLGLGYSARALQEHGTKE